VFETERHTKLPRLLDRDKPPSLASRRRYWRYVHRWRSYLFHQWRHDTLAASLEQETIQNVDDLLALVLLSEYCRRWRCIELPLISEVHQRLTHPTVAAIAAGIAAEVPDPFVAAVLNSGTFSGELLVPRCVVGSNWETRLKNATWLLYRDRSIPLSLFGDFYQLCVGNPVNTDLTEQEGKRTRRSRGMFYTPAPIVDYLVASTLAPVLDGRTPEEILQVRLLDPSCGCGAFLIASFRYILSRILRHPGLGHKSTCELSLTVLGDVLHGCDIDCGAVNWAIRLQLMAAWESLDALGDSCGIASNLMCPILQDTIRCGNFLEARASRNSRPSPASYDVVLGGPPFVRLECLHDTQEDKLRLYQQRFLTARHGQYDLYMLFIERALDLLREGGRIAFSVSNSFLRTDSGRMIRGYIAANACVEEIVELENPMLTAVQKCGAGRPNFAALGW